MSSTWKYVLAYLLAIQLALPLIVPTPWLYEHRVPYAVFKEDPRVLDQVLDHLARRIRRERLAGYVIILGDSVGYSGPGGPDQSIGYYMEQLSREAGRELTVFNLALPAMQLGDLYVLLLKLQERGIATDRVVINLLYAGFAARTPGPAIAFWLADDLRRLDPGSWDRFRDHLALNQRIKTPHTLADLFNQHLAPHIALLAHRPVLKAQVMRWLAPLGGEVYDTRPWTAKPELPRLVTDYAWAFSPAPFDMTAANPQIYFLEKILDLTKGSPPLIYLTPTNQALMQAQVTQAGYQENLRRIDAWFAGRPVTYLNLERSIEDHLFADHLHLTPEGYRHLAGLLLQHLEPGR